MTSIPYFIKPQALRQYLVCFQISHLALELSRDEKEYLITVTTYYTVTLISIIQSYYTDTKVTDSIPRQTLNDHKTEGYNLWGELYTGTVNNSFKDKLAVQCEIGFFGKEHDLSVCILTCTCTTVLQYS